MAQTPEGKVKAEVRKILKKAEVYFFSPAANGFGRAGIPDFICCVDGLFLGIECKAGKNGLTTLQQRELTAIENNNGATFVATEATLDELAEFVEELKADTRTIRVLVH